MMEINNNVNTEEMMENNAIESTQLLTQEDSVMTACDSEQTLTHCIEEDEIKENLSDLTDSKDTEEMMEQNEHETIEEKVEELVNCKKAFMVDDDKRRLVAACSHFLSEEMNKRNIAEIEQSDIDKMKIKIAVDKEIGSNFQNMMHGLTVMALVDVSDYFATRVKVREKSLNKCFEFTMEKVKKLRPDKDAAVFRGGMAVSSSMVIPWIIEYYLKEVTQKDIEAYEKELKEAEERKAKAKQAKDKAKAKSKSSTKPKEPSLFDQIPDEDSNEDEISSEVIGTTPAETEDKTSNVEEVVETTKETVDTKPVEEEVIETTPEPTEKKVPKFEAISLFDL